MKKSRLSKKLRLNKQTIAALNKESLGYIKGAIVTINQPCNNPTETACGDPCASEVATCAATCAATCVASCDTCDTCGGPTCLTKDLQRNC